MKTKLETLLGLLKEMESAVLAYSGGVDSSFLLKALKLSGIKFIAATSISESLPEGDLEMARRIAKELQVDHILIEGKELMDEDFLKNDRKRCFYCKSSLFKELIDIKERTGHNFVIEGSTIDDLSDYRPGLEAAQLFGVRSPLIEAGLYKEEIRVLSRELGLPAWNRPSSPCLASRIPYGTRITPQRLRRISEAEKVLKDLGFNVVRVRDYWPMAKIEIAEEEFGGLLEKRDEIVRGIKAAGYTIVTFDLEGYRQGKLNNSSGQIDNLYFSGFSW